MSLSANVSIPIKEQGLRSYKVEDAVHIYKGALVCLDTNGYATPAADTASFVFVGIAEEEVDNTLTGHTAGTKRVRVRSNCRAVVTTSGATQASVGTAVVITDDSAVAASSVHSVAAGKVDEYFSATSVSINIPPLP